MTTTKSAKRSPKKSSGRVTEPKPRKDIYSDIANKLIELSLAQQKLVWHMEWKHLGLGPTGLAMPRSVASGKLYRGINPWLLMAAILENGWKSQWFATYDEWARLSGAVKDDKGRWSHPEGIDFGVRRGEKGTKIVFWSKIHVDAKDANGNLIMDPETGKAKRKRIFILREFTVFNQDQCYQEALPKKFQPTPEAEVEEETEPAFDPIAEAEAILAGYTEVEIRHGGDRAYYSPGGDYIGMPERHQFERAEAYYSTAFHECGHSTGHRSRLARPDLMESHHFGDTSYSKEELTAEMTAAMLCGIAGIENATIDNSAAYLQHWVAKLRDEPKWLVQAAAQAQKAADWILGIRYQDCEEEVTA